MIQLDNEQLLRLYTFYSDKQVEEWVDADLLRVQTEKPRAWPATSYDEPLRILEAEAHHRGFFFWHHFEDDPETGEDSSVYTLEEIKPTPTFDISVSESRFNEIEQLITDQTPGNVLYPESHELAYEAHRNGFSFEWDRGARRWICHPLEGASK